MTTTSVHKNARAHRSASKYSETELLQARIHNVGNKFLSFINSLPEDRLAALLTLPDEEFWTEIKYAALSQRLIEASTAEKKEQEEYAEARLVFLKTLEKYGGVHKSTKVKELLGLSAPTIHKYGRQNKLIQLNWGAENLYPVFQFSTDPNNSENGMLKGVPELLSLLTHNVSDVRKCNFFTRKVDLPGNKERVTAIDVLRRGATSEEMESLRILAENFGTNHTL
ncbi:hypothetical protein [Cronobacter dublinensis]|uniref:hypothetical protein n=1 Tax=Cronobacter dublinensis TaxID=413497 RepID=UPI0013761B7E|nr:hypothetical protein [Cronobacter dublinensis]NCH98007.1 hypothetical protein [Cronobacter dublinensis]